MGNNETVVAAEGDELDETTGNKEIVEGDGSGDNEPGENAEGDEAGEQDAEGADAIRKDEIKGLPEEAQQAVNRRISKVVAKEKAAIERAETAETELESLKGKLDGGFPEMVKRLGVHGELVSTGEAKTLEEYGKLKAQKQWCRKHEDGYEGADGTVEAAEVRSKLSDIEDQMDELAPRAREIQTRIDKQAREIWAAGVAALKNKGKTPVKGEQPRTPAKKIVKPPAIPSGSGIPKAPASAKKSQGKFSTEEFIKDGGGKSALQKQFDKIYG